MKKEKKKKIEVVKTEIKADIFYSPSEIVNAPSESIATETVIENGEVKELVITNQAKKKEVLFLQTNHQGRRGRNK